MAVSITIVIKILIVIVRLIVNVILVLILMLILLVNLVMGTITCRYLSMLSPHWTSLEGRRGVPHIKN